jgi:hypothetical protein
MLQESLEHAPELVDATHLGALAGADGPHAACGGTPSKPLLRSTFYL